MARSPMVRIPGEAPKLEQSEPEAREAPANAVGDVEDAPAPRKSGAVAPASDLPDADTIDMRTVTKTILTRQGWLCPLPEYDELANRQAPRR